MNSRLLKNIGLVFCAALCSLACDWHAPKTTIAFAGLEATNGAGTTDPWEKLRMITQDADPGAEASGPRNQPQDDPWARLRAIYLPFTEQEEIAAETDRDIRRKISGRLHSAVAPYRDLIREASLRFDVPPEIIAAVIMVESGGDPAAKAATSTAAGLMQTISATFSDAREALARIGTPITECPFDPASSILAGTWYLDRMYARARADRPEAVGPRARIASWKYPLEYYYAGPGHGVKRDPVVIIYSEGRRIVVDKPAYSAKVLKWAEIMSRPDTPQQ